MSNRIAAYFCVMGWWLLMGDMLTYLAINEQSALTIVGDIFLLAGVSMWTQTIKGDKRITWDWSFLMFTLGASPYVVHQRLQGDYGCLCGWGLWLVLCQPFIILYVALWYHFGEAMRMLKEANLVAVADFLEGLAA
jgi:hypothetical protein